MSCASIFLYVPCHACAQAVLAVGVAVRVLAANVGFMADLLGANSRGAPGDATRWLLPPALADMKADRA